MHMPLGSGYTVMCICRGLEVKVRKLWPTSLVPLHVECQVIGAGEAAPAVVALEGLGSRVFPKVAGEFVGSGEPPLTAFPRTLVRLLTCRRERENY